MNRIIEATSIIFTAPFVLAFCYVAIALVYLFERQENKLAQQ